MMDENETAPGKRRRLKVSHILIILLLIGAGSFALYRLNLKSKLQARIDAIRAAGYPVTCYELDEWYKIPPDAENAAYTNEEAFSLYNRAKSRSSSCFLEAKLPPRTEPLAGETRSFAAQYLADNKEALELLHAGAAIENCRYSIDLRAGCGTLMPHINEMRMGVFLLRIEGILHAENGDGRSAVRSAISVFGMARSFAKEPLMISQNVRAAYQALAISTIERIINRTKLTDEQLVELAEHVRESERICDVSRAIAGDRCMGISFFRVPESHPDIADTPPVRLALAFYRAVGRTDADAIIYLDLMDAYLKAAELPLHRRQEAANAVNARFKATSQDRWLLREVMPTFPGTIALDIRTIAHLRTADAALAVQRYRLAADKLPDKLADLVPTYLGSVQKDPFDGNEMRYKKLDTGFVVYCIGEDLSDDGGKEKPPRSKRTEESSNWDVTFIVER